ncbi:hypothetical protein GGR57DRAFT_224198 [Xylariaceae sp. FL1272]|nr:hypothetical protein GGR57DRAFT_224198 [Xylariaceae sp. FL1272]
MGDNAIGFAFQGDVVNVASLAHLLTGRILKALSDGSIDFYAVAASIWIGKHINARSSLESGVHAHLAAKKGVQGWLAKTLSIGWGHSPIPVEMSRTKAGSNALLLIEALATGSSYFDAAQCLSSILSISGCEADKIPNVDVLKSLVAYLAPFLQDLGFPKVLQHITSSVTHNVLKIQNDCPPGLTAVGEATVLASAIKQLAFTSQNDETVYLVVRQRGAWLSAFASHILGMSVEVQLNDTVLWASGGTNGRAVFQLSAEARSVRRISESGFILVDAPRTEAGQAQLSIDYALGDALNAELSYHPSLGETMVKAIHFAIARLSFALFYKLKVESDFNYSSHGPRRILGHFQTNATLVRTLSHFGITIPDDPSELRIRHTLDFSWTGTPAEKNGLSCLSGTEAEILRDLCHLHQNGATSTQQRCICSHIGGIIHGFSSTALALVLCRYKVPEIRMRSNVLTGKIKTRWNERCVFWGEDPRPVSNYHLFSHLSMLFHDVDDTVGESYAFRIPPETAIIGVSDGGYTIVYTCLLEEEHAYDDCGRLITITTGRASVQGSLRKLILETLRHQEQVDLPNPQELTTAAPGSLIEPHYRPSSFSIFMDARLREREIYVTTTCGQDRSKSRLVTLVGALHLFLLSANVRAHCQHPVNRPFEVKPNLPYEFFIAGLGYTTITGGGKAAAVIYALTGKRMEQILLMMFRPPATKRGERIEYQIFACAHCTLSKLPLPAENDDSRVIDQAIVLAG